MLKLEPFTKNIGLDQVRYRQHLCSIPEGLRGDTRGAGRDRGGGQRVCPCPPRPGLGTSGMGGCAPRTFRESSTKVGVCFFIF